MNDIKLGFIGYGRHAKNNLYPSLKLLDQPVQAIATTSEESSEQGKKEQGAVNSYSDYKEMFSKEDLDAVIISAPPKMHLQLTLDALDAGLHVFVEKPLGYTADEAQQAADKSKEVGKHVMVGFMKRYAPAYQKATEIVHNDKFGELVTVNGMFGTRNFAKSAEEILLFAAIHYADMLVHFTDEPKRLSSFERSTDDALTISFVYESVTGVTVSMAFIATPSWAKLNEELYLTGTNGYVHVNNVEKLSYHFNPIPSDVPRWQTMDEEETTVTTVSTTSSGGSKDLYQRGFVPELQHFLDSIRNDTTPLTSAEENVKTMKLVDKIINRGN